jgi:hypothetical protein
MRFLTIFFNLASLFGVFAIFLLFPSFFLSKLQEDLINDKIETFNRENIGLTDSDIDKIIPDINSKLTILDKKKNEKQFGKDILEEVIGDINDEYDDARPELNFKKLDAYNYIFDGKTMLNDVCEILHIKSEIFEGPLDLLLSLIEKRKLLINEVSLAKITDDYIAHIQNASEQSMRDQSNFILIASTLLLIKSKSLLPNRLFEPYITTKGEKGTGIGLQLVKKIITDHFKASIRAYNTDVGACFEILFPVGTTLEKE